MKEAFGYLLFAGLHLVGVAAHGQTTTAGPEREPVRFVVQGKDAQYSADGRHATLRDARVTILAPGYTHRRAIVDAQQLQADLKRGVITTTGGGRLLVGPLVLTGDELRFDAGEEEFEIKRARGFMALPSPYATQGHPMPMAFFSGGRIAKTKDTIHINHGRLTTCPKDRPDYYIKAKRIKYDVKSEEVTIRNASLHLYGITLPLIPWAKVSVADRAQRSGKHFSLGTAPGYSNREGVYLPYALRLTGPDDPWKAFTSFRLTTKRGITGSAWADRSTGRWDLGARVSRREWAADDVTDRLSIDAYPELTFTRHLRTRDDRDTTCNLDLGFGNLREELESEPVDAPQRPRVHEQRAAAALSYTANASQYRGRDGDWYGAQARVSTYSSGETYRDLEVFAGLGGGLSRDLQAHTTVRHHFTGGSTPFLFDDVDIKTELESSATWQLARRWGATAWSRYDLDQADMRDYEVGLNYRAGCLTWGLYYRDVGNRIGIRADITGLTGGTRPVARKSSFVQQMEREGLSIAPLGAGGAPVVTDDKNASQAPSGADGVAPGRTEGPEQNQGAVR